MYLGGVLGLGGEGSGFKEALQDLGRTALQNVQGRKAGGLSFREGERALLCTVSTGIFDRFR